MHQHRAGADGVALQLLDLEIIYLAPVMVNFNCGNWRKAAIFEQKHVANAQVGRVDPAAWDLGLIGRYRHVFRPGPALQFLAFDNPEGMAVGDLDGFVPDREPQQFLIDGTRERPQHVPEFPLAVLDVEGPHAQGERIKLGHGAGFKSGIFVSSGFSAVELMGIMVSFAKQVLKNGSFCSLDRFGAVDCVSTALGKPTENQGILTRLSIL